MSQIIAMALAVLFEVLKNKREAQKIQAALFKLHGIIEATFPQLKPEVRTNTADEVQR